MVDATGMNMRPCASEHAEIVKVASEHTRCGGTWKRVVITVVLGAWELVVCV